MCNDPNSPNPQKFCCMRGWVITCIVFGTLEVLSGLNNIQAVIAGEPCYICPTNKVDYVADAGYNCWIGAEVKGNSHELEDPTNFPHYTKAKCDAANGDWRVYSCADAHSFWLGLQAVRGGSETCTKWQNIYKDTCCVAGAAPPNSTQNALFQMLFNLLTGTLKIVGGAMLSCCCGQPTPGKMKCSKFTLGAALLVDLILLVIVFVGIGAVTNADATEFWGPQIATFLVIFVIVAIVWQIIQIVIVSVALLQIRGAEREGIGAAPKGGPSI